MKADHQHGLGLAFQGQNDQGAHGTGTGAEKGGTEIQQAQAGTQLTFLSTVVRLNPNWINITNRALSVTG